MKSTLARTGKRSHVTFGVLLILAGFAFSPAVVYADKDHHAATISQGREQAVQTECPVMIGNKIDPDLYSDYKGKRVYFCCNSCKSAFDKDPERYLHRLPQFATASGEAGHEHAHGGFSSASLIVPMGIATLSLVAITVFLGLFRRLKPRLMLKWHKRTGVLALLAGTIHAVLVLVAH